MSDNNGNGFWKWVCGGLIALIGSNCLTAYAFKTDPKDIRELIAESFTATSNTQGMYALEGRPKIAALESKFASIEAELKQINTTLIQLTAEMKRRP